MQVNGWELLAVCQTLINFGDHRHSVSGDLGFLICHMSSLDHIFNGLNEFMGGSPSH